MLTGNWRGGGRVCKKEGGGDFWMPFVWFGASREVASCSEGSVKGGGE